MTDSVARTGRTAPRIRSAFLSADDPRWAASLPTLRHDIYHLPGYVAFAARHQETGTAMAYLAEAGDHRLLLPLIERPLPGEARGAPSRTDATSPRGFPGPVTDERAERGSDAFVDAALASFVQALREQGMVSAFIRLHPLLAPPGDVLRRHGTLVDVGDSFSIDLATSDEALWGQMRLNHRRDIARASKAGYTARADEGWDRFEGFVSAFQQTMVRLDAEAHWRLAREYFSDLRAALGDAVHLCVVEVDGELAAACLITESDGIAEYHLAGTADEHVRASPSKLLIWFACGWARARGNRVLHLAGTPRPGDSLSHFKAGFSPQRHPMRSWRVIGDHAAYAELVRDWEERTGEDADSTGGYFPAYRKPGGAAHPP